MVSSFQPTALSTEKTFLIKTASCFKIFDREANSIKTPQVLNCKFKYNNNNNNNDRLTAFDPGQPG